MSPRTVTSSAPVAAPPARDGDRPIDNRRGILAMVLAMGFFVVSDSLVKVIGRDINLGQILLVRGLIASAIMIALACAFGWLGDLWRSVTGPARTRLAIRTLAETVASMCFFTGMLNLPFADNAAIGQLAPLAVTAGAALFLGEPVGWRRWLATIAGFIGVLIIIRPGTSAFDWAALWTLTSVAFIALRDLLTTRIPPEVPSHHIVAITSIGITAGSLVLVAAQPWRPIALVHVGGLAIAAGGVLAAFYCLVTAMRVGEISLVGPFRYAVIVFSVIIGTLVFQEPLSLTTMLGMAIVVGAGIYTLHREQMRRRALRQAG